MHNHADAHKGGGRWLGRVEGSKIVYPLAILSEKQEAFRLSTVCTYVYLRYKHERKDIS